MSSTKKDTQKEETSQASFYDKAIESALSPHYKEVIEEEVIDSAGEVKTTKRTTITKELPQDPALIMSLMAQQIGGPQDYC